MFALGAAPPNFKAIAEGKVAAKAAFEVINRKPTINDSSLLGKSIDLKGSIELRGVSFFYPSRAEKKVLDTLSATFEVG